MFPEFFSEFSHIESEFKNKCRHKLAQERTKKDNNNKQVIRNLIF